MHSGESPPNIGGGDSSHPRVAAGRYRLDEEIGRGGMGAVYRAWDEHLQRWVAIKRLRPRTPDDRRAGARLLREARAASALNHPAIVQVHDVVEGEDGEAYLVQELVAGRSLRELLGEPWSLERFYALAIDCAGALSAATAEGVVHCDLKPENIVVNEDGRARILDFGIARQVVCPEDAEPKPAAMRVAEEAASDDEVTRTMEAAGLRGTPAYMAPELIAGRPPDARADLFCLGLIFYELLTGRHPFRRSTVAATLVALDRDEPAAPSRWNAHVPPRLDRLVLRMLAKDPEQRCPSARELLSELHELEEQRPGKRAVARVSRRRTAWIAVAVAVAAAAGWWAVDQQLDTGPGTAGAAVPYLVVDDFQNLSEHPSDEYLALGLAEAVRTHLASLEGIQVVEPKDDLGVKLALEGSVQRAGDELRINYRLIDRGSGVVLAASMVEGEIERLFALQDRVTHEAAQALADEFGFGTMPPERQQPTSDVSAYDYYLQARGYLQRPADQNELHIAADLFRRARELDEGFTQALAGLGETYWKLFEETKDPEWAREAEEVSQAALEEDPSRVEVQITLGTIYHGTGRYQAASDAFQRALELDPRSAPAYVGLARAQMELGELAAAEETFREAIRVRPGDWWSHSQLGGFYAGQNRFEEAAEAFRRVVELTPDNARGYSNLGAVLILAGRNEEAIDALERSIDLRPNYRAYTNLAMAYRYEGRLQDAVHSYQQALALDPRDHRVWGNLGSIHVLLEGHTAEADSAFARALELADDMTSVNPNDALLHAWRAQYLAALDRDQESRREVSRALALAPDRGDVLYYVSSVFETLGDREAALNAVEQAVRAGYPVEVWHKEPFLKRLVADPRFEHVVGNAQQ